MKSFTALLFFTLLIASCFSFPKSSDSDSAEAKTSVLLNKLSDPAQLEGTSNTKREKRWHNGYGGYGGYGGGYGGYGGGYGGYGGGHGGYGGYYGR